jgi:hypothetical protein
MFQAWTIVIGLVNSSYNCFLFEINLIPICTVTVFDSKSEKLCVVLIETTDIKYEFYD